MKNIEKVVIPVIIIVLITMLGIYYISKEYKKQQAEKRAEEIKETAEAESPVSSEDLVYETIAMLVGKDEENHKLKFISVDNDKLFELDYSNKTPILGKHGNSLTLDQIPLGEILDASYSIHSRELYELRVSDEAWTFTDVTKFEINDAENRMDIAGSTYKLPKTSIVSYKDELASFMDVTNVDTLTVKGYGRKVCSIIVERGHGYVRLQNDSYFEGGWIEIGQDIIKVVTEEMLIPVPEGTYHVRLTNRGYAAEEDVLIERDKETMIDLSKVDIKEVSIGHVAFSIVPDYAQLYVDGQMTDFEERVAMEYGIHRVHVELAGYKSVDTNIRVSDKYVDISIALEKDDGESDSSTKKTTTTRKSTTGTSTTATPKTTSTSTTSPIFGPFTTVVTPVPTSSSSTTDKTTTQKTTSTESTSTTQETDSSTEEVISDTRKMYVEAPEGAEVFLDGVYVGIAPASFIKPERGSHVITLSKNGCITKSYTVSVADDDKDVTLSFSDLVPQQEETE